MRLTTRLTPEEFRDAFRSRLDGTLGSRRGGFYGWTLGTLFSVRYTRARGFLQRSDIVENKIMGFIRQGDLDTELVYLHFPGMTDPISLLSFYVLVLLFLFLSGDFRGAPQTILGISSLVIILFALLSAVVSKTTERGMDAQMKLEQFLRDAADDR